MKNLLFALSFQIKFLTNASLVAKHTEKEKTFKDERKRLL